VNAMNECERISEELDAHRKALRANK